MEWTLKEAAETLEISVKALRYRIKANGLEPRVEDGAHGPRYVLNADQLKLLRTVPKDTELRDRPQPQGWSKLAQEGPRVYGDGSQEAQYRTGEPQERPQASSGTSWRVVPIEVHLEAQEALREALELSREQREDRLEAERRAQEAEERAMRIARQAQAMAEELGSQKRLLAENAESLLERKAKVQEYEARVTEAVDRQVEAQSHLEELYRHTAEEKARYEQEREEMLRRLEESEAKAARLERLPRWVMTFFGK